MPSATAGQKDRNVPAEGDLAHDSPQAGDRTEVLPVIGERDQAHRNPSPSIATSNVPLPRAVDESGIGQKAQEAPIRLPQAENVSELLGTSFDLADLDRHRPVAQDYVSYLRHT